MQFGSASWEYRKRKITKTGLTLPKADGQGVPYLIDWYPCKSASEGPMELRIHELPMNNSVVVFGEDHGK